MIRVVDLQTNIKEIFDLDIPIDIIDLIVNYHRYVTKNILNSFISGSVPITYNFEGLCREKTRDKIISELSCEEIDAICVSLNIILRSVDQKADLNPCDIKKYLAMDTYYYNREEAHDNRWYLIIYSSCLGKIYDFSGWPNACLRKRGIGLLKLPWNLSIIEDNYITIYSSHSNYIYPIPEFNDLKVFYQFDYKRISYVLFY